ncbi:SulP family inorganic anion transporter [Bacillus licheniformis]|uniref:Sulfate transporter/antisigma-factor antagonist YbaR n=3 Tax=Bacillati TaxID=1783272 RepID=Q65CP7_BACLD|nr:MULTISPECIES: SulP family inorganic anion transporter [Bacillus]MBY8348649.1 SulP family inorganic anion transporter [Bacillus sp. PCH94]MDP4082228.1 SulP family inorganic anion transporter [Bacillota bacterium]AAU25785.1 putative Sulfate transporter/antisigma-factor antagonist YbaR [Bacillus licheniformis DSM 13 = ATCC 14580]AAU43167.1 putative sulfate transporter YbaR [Bacillus licheniformis DSM 13 = ATCC 14580]AKQ75624.1 sulfate transporter/antisigma-factor antagonist YbaR [Bacillus lich
MNVKQLNSEWFSNVRGDILSGIVVALALIPEAIAFSIIAGVDPMVGLYASFCIAVVISFTGGRPAMISAATGAMALLMGTLVRDHGLDYLFAATILTGIIQLIFGVLKIARFMKFIPRSVMVGFVNALAILIFMAQVPHFVGVSNMTYVVAGITLLIIYVLPRFTKAVPSALVAIIAMTVFAIFGHFDLRTVGDLGEMKQSLPAFMIPNIPFNFETLAIIFPTAFALSIVGLLESLLTSSIVDDMTDTESDKNRESRGQGIANIVAGFFGGMAGCAMIGQSVINVKSGGRGRLSTFVAGVFLMFLIMVLGDWVVQIPMAALAGVMIMVSIGTFDWSSFSMLRKVPLTDSIVMIVTVVTVVATHDLSKGVFAGVILSAIFFVAKISKLKIEEKSEENAVKYIIKGQVFFASVQDFVNSFKTGEQTKKVILDFSEAHIWDDSAVAAIDKVVLKMKEQGIDVDLIGLNESSWKLVEKLATYDQPHRSVSNH